MQRLSALSRSIAGSVVLITGAASGMGRATARLFADEGAHVAVTDVHGSDVARVVDEIQREGLSASGWEMDVADSDAVTTAVTGVVERWARLDVVVNNAGFSRPAPIDADDYETRWAQMLDVLLTGQTRVIRASLPYLRQAPEPRIINIASTEAWGATRHLSPYTAAKHGVVGLTKSLAVELGREGITVNCVCPGPINTGITADIAEEDKRAFARRRTALGRYGEPEEVAHATLNFALPSSRYMTGAVLVVDGGLLARNA